MLLFQRSVPRKIQKHKLFIFLDRFRFNLNVHKITSMATCKVVLIGDSQVGKTTLIHRFVHDEYKSDFKSTVGVAFCQKRIRTEQTYIETQIWDTAGTERFCSLGSAFYHGSDCGIVVFDVTCRASFEHVDAWIGDFMKCAKTEYTKDLPVVVFANKAEMPNVEVTEEEIKQWASQRGVKWFYTSAKDGTNIDNAFNYIMERFYKARSRQLLALDPNVRAVWGSRCC